MITGYIIENILGYLLAISLLRLHHRPGSQQAGNTKLLDRCTIVAVRGCNSFRDCATFFTFSIQLACITVLSRLDFGISANGMGDSTAKITWAVSLLTILPLMYIAFNSSLLREPLAAPMSDSTGQKNKVSREQLRFFLFVICWLLSIYPFLSRMMETFGPSSIGGNNQVISTSDWTVIQAACTNNVRAVTSRELVAMDFSNVAGSLWVFVLVLTKVIWHAMQRQHEQSRLVQYIRGRWSKRISQNASLSIVLFITLPTIAVSQIWIIFRMRNFQQQVSKASGNYDSDGDWTFGQIAAVTVFVPVLVECWFTWLYE